jgi:hypothetical protein
MKCNFSQIIAFGAKLDSFVRTAASVYATIGASSYRVLHEGHITVLQRFSLLGRIVSGSKVCMPWLIYRLCQPGHDARNRSTDK